MHIVKNRKFYYSISSILVLASIIALFVWGLNLGIDFKGGSILEVKYEKVETRPAQEAVVKALAPLEVSASVRPTGDTGYIVRMKALSEPERLKVSEAMTVDGKAKFETVRFDSIGPLLGREAAQNAAFSIVLVILCIVLFITYAFRGVSKPIASWKYGLIAIVALVHDVLIPTGVFAFLGHYSGYEVDTLFVTALLVVLGFSIHDTIVVFDRVRENLHLARANEPFEEIVGKSISQTFTRSINTSLTTILALVVLYLVGPEATHQFSLALIIGLVAGTYSSIFLGSPLLVTVEKWQRARLAKR